jgi:hypothetical protein
MQLKLLIPFDQRDVVKTLVLQKGEKLENTRGSKRGSRKDGRQEGDH